MNRDDALLAFERHATSKLRTADDLLSIATLGFRGEALPSIASVARVTLETATGEEAAGTRIEIAGGKILHVDDAALPRGTTIAVADLFFNTPARRKFLRAESTELAHVTALVTHYALAHPEKHFELVSASHTIVSAPPVPRTAERIYQIFGKDTLANCCPWPPKRRWRTRPARAAAVEERPRRAAARSRHPAADRLLLQAGAAKAQSQLDLYLCEQAAYPRPAADARDHRGLSQRDSAHQLPGGAAVSGDAARRGGRERAPGQRPRCAFRQQSLVHDFVRDSLRTALIKARPAAGFLAALDSQPLASPSLMPPALSPLARVAGRFRPRSRKPTPIRRPFQPGRECASPSS
jgi:DNA mismatch repair protein MutL